ncbi:MAG: dNTP triphosphohydrolase [Ruminococcus sp.]|jgi:dGTPase|nr:dNTP triphosphohydrolase [Ruminococcus sp.]
MAQSSRAHSEEFLSDHSYIVYCTAFRRLQQKAQVFSLETDSAIRSRLTHSLEVADTGRRLANDIVGRLREEKGEDVDLLSVCSVVENACLLHDIGNPPFGHFGEMAIQKWARDNGLGVYKEAFGRAPESRTHINLLLSDFINFDGNPQGIRTILHLGAVKTSGLDGKNGLNLTIPTILSVIKYPWHIKPEGKKKIGYFFSEKDDVETCCFSIGWNKGIKYPLMYIMEASDDICYSLSDISDGIEKGVITLADFCKDLFDEIVYVSGGEDFDKIKSLIEYNSHRRGKSPQKDSLNELTITICRYMMKTAADSFLENYDRILSGTYEGDLLTNNSSAILKNAIKTVCRKNLYRSYEAEKVEISGFRIITGLLTHFSTLLSLKKEVFENLLEIKEKGRTKECDEYKSAPRDIELRILSRISNNAINAYKSYKALYESGGYRPFGMGNITDREFEWWLRFHMIIDHISGMTDRFALETYQMFEGINIA